MLEEAAGAALPHGEMPGGLPGDNFVHLDFLEEEGDVEDAEPVPANAREVIPIEDRALPVPENDDEDDDEDEDEDAFDEVGIFVNSQFAALNGDRLRRCLFASCVIWSVDSGVAPAPMRRPRLMKDHREKPSWMV